MGFDSIAFETLIDEPLRSGETDKAHGQKLLLTKVYRRPQDLDKKYRYRLTQYKNKVDNLLKDDHIVKAKKAYMKIWETTITTDTDEPKLKPTKTAWLNYLEQYKKEAG